MADVFVSYARNDKARVAPLVAAIEAQGWSVWWDPEIDAGQQFDDQIEEELKSARAVLVVWTPASVASRWVRGEAREAADRGTLVPARFDGARMPMDVRAIHTTDLDDWAGNPDSPSFQALLRALGTMIARQGGSAAATAPAAPTRIGVCVLPFVNMSGDPEQEYFSDGISEDVITDLSKVSALAVVSRNSAFMYKGKLVDVPKVARELKVQYVLEGSVRKSGGRVRITAQLVDGSSNDNVWAERYDRDLNDIFALQDEISEAIVKALKLKLLPEEKKAIEQRGTTNLEAYNLYLMARQHYATGNEGDIRRNDAIVRLCQRAAEIDPNYAQAWALKALGQMLGRLIRGGQVDDGLAAADRALALDPNLAAAHAVRARILSESGRHEEAGEEIEVALRLDRESYEVNRAAAYLRFRQKRLPEAVRHFEKAQSLMEADVSSPNMLITCYTALGDRESLRRVAQITLERAQRTLAQDPSNGAAMAFCFNGMAALGQSESAKGWMSRALLIEPDNANMRYNFACALACQLHDADAAIELLAPLFERISIGLLNHAKADPDLDSLRGIPRFQAMVATAEARLSSVGS
ncbi:MAG: TIR domain-containing protein [Steroidobacteraceae bacterium]|nr:TIR domain-containing protein [Steroidobacteraceae bacterium]